MKNNSRVTKVHNSINSPNGKQPKSNKNSELPLKGMTVCISGFSQIEGKLLKEKIEKYGGNFNDNLTGRTNYLITNKINSNKSIAAQQHNMKLVTKEWILNEGGEKFLEEEKCKPPCFMGVDLNLYGFSEVERNIMREKVEKNGGGVVESVEEAEVIIIKDDLAFIEEEIEKLKKYEGKMASEKWFKECVSGGKYKNYSQYKITSNIISYKYEEIINNIEKYNYKNLFLGKVFGVIGFKNDIRLKIINIISFCNGIFFENVYENTNFVIVPLTYDDTTGIKNLLNVFNECPKIVTINWLFDSFYKGQILSENLYKPLKSLDTNINKTNKKILYTGNIFKNQTFSIYNSTYSQEKILDIKEKIISNMGEYFDAGDSCELKDFKAKFIVLNDGHPVIWDKVIKENAMKMYHKIIISHRYIDECLRQKEIFDFTEFFDMIPFSFSVPLDEFLSYRFFLPPNQFSLHEINCYEQLIETLGGYVDELNENTTHILFKKNKIKKKTLDLLIKKSNKNIKCVNEDCLMDYILKSGRSNIDNYLINIEDEDEDKDKDKDKEKKKEIDNDNKK